MTDISRSYVTSVNSRVDDWQLSVLRNPGGDILYLRPRVKVTL